jgi:hypothetical protein
MSSLAVRLDLLQEMPQLIYLPAVQLGQLEVSLRLSFLPFISRLSGSATLDCGIHRFIIGYWDLARGSRTNRPLNFRAP